VAADPNDKPESWVMIAMSTELRKTGIDAVGDMPWGTHFCLFYETKEDLLDTLISYCKAGFSAGESPGDKHIASLERDFIEPQPFAAACIATEHPGRSQL